MQENKKIKIKDLELTLSKLDSRDIHLKPIRIEKEEMLRDRHYQILDNYNEFLTSNKPSLRVGINQFDIAIIKAITKFIKQVQPDEKIYYLIPKNQTRSSQRTIFKQTTRPQNKKIIRPRKRK